MLRNDLSTQHEECSEINCPHVIITARTCCAVVQSKKLMPTIAKINTIKDSQVNEKDDSTFCWTDKEAEFLLENIKIVKVNMEAEGVDWESFELNMRK